ncbi:MAG TPA: hypothetical protein VFC19_21115 [Candidatus Limnocylindrales bacterium]|nr:hypothetical protein [Candidatus Limnocylindrales bacterium]
MSGNLPVLHEQLLEDDLVHGLLERGTALDIEGLGILEQLHGGQEELPTVVELGAGVLELALDLSALLLDVT